MSGLLNVSRGCQYIVAKLFSATEIVMDSWFTNDKILHRQIGRHKMVNWLRMLTCFYLFFILPMSPVRKFWNKWWQFYVNLFQLWRFYMFDLLCLWGNCDSFGGVRVSDLALSPFPWIPNINNRDIHEDSIIDCVVESLSIWQWSNIL